MSSATLIAGQYAIHRGREEGGEGRATGDLKTTSLTIENLLVLSVCLCMCVCVGLEMENKNNTEWLGGVLSATFRINLVE